MSEPLTREQVEEFLHKFILLDLHGNPELAAQALLDHDAALRAQLAACEQERDGLKESRDNNIKLGTNLQDLLAAAQAEIARLTLKLNRFYELGIDCQGHSCYYAKEKTGMRHNGPCHCLRNFKDNKHLESRTARYREALVTTLEALQWTTGSPSFGADGEARQGFIKLVRPAMEQAQQALAEDK